jgi:hypothetical protein
MTSLLTHQVSALAESMKGMKTKHSLPAPIFYSPSWCSGLARFSFKEQTPVRFWLTAPFRINKRRTS